GKAQKERMFFRFAPEIGHSPRRFHRSKREVPPKNSNAGLHFDPSGAARSPGDARPLTVPMDADTVMHQLSTWINHYNEVHPHKALGYPSPREFIAAHGSPWPCPVVRGLQQRSRAPPVID